MKAYRGYKTKKDCELDKNHVWLHLDVHDAAFYNSHGTVDEYTLDESRLRPVPEEELLHLDEFDWPAFPNRLMLLQFIQNGHNCYFHQWPEFKEKSICIFDKSLLGEPRTVFRPDSSCHGLCVAGLHNDTAAV